MRGLVGPVNATTPAGRRFDPTCWLLYAKSFQLLSFSRARDVYSTSTRCRKPSHVVTAHTRNDQKLDKKHKITTQDPQGVFDESSGQSEYVVEAILGSLVAQTRQPLYDTYDLTRTCRHRHALFKKGALTLFPQTQVTPYPLHPIFPSLFKRMQLLRAK